MEWQKPVAEDRSEVLSWLAAARNAAAHLKEQAAAGRTFESIGDERLAGVEAGTIGRRKGRSKPYSQATFADYARAYRNVLRPEFGPMPADDIGELEWQMWCDRLSREGLSRSRISTLVAVASAIYAWGLTPTRRYATRNPLRLIELQPNNERPRLRETPGMEQLIADQEQYAPDETPSIDFPLAYSQGMVVEQILRKAIDSGDLTRDGILAAKENLGEVDLGGITPSVTYTPEGGPPSCNTLITENARACRAS